MPLFDDVPEEQVAKHLLLCGDTKTGKSDYFANAILDGFHGICVDSDNGANTIAQVLGHNRAARRRLIYIKTKNPYHFMRAFTDSGLMRWNLTQDKLFVGKSSDVPDTDMIVELRRNRIPPGFIFSLDSWSTCAYQAMETGAKAANLDLLDPNVEKRKAYGAAGAGLTKIAEMFQRAQFHEIIQAHGSRYEVREKSPGNVKDQSKESEMTIKEIITVPVSSSNPHGIIVARHFNEIGWLETNRMGNQVLSFKKKHDRLGGGTKNGEGNPRAEYSFKNLFGEPIAYSDEDVAAFYREFPASEYVPAANPMAHKPAPATPASASGTLPKAGSVGSLSSMMKK